MAFIQLQAQSDNPDKAFLLNTDHLVSVSLAPYTGSQFGYTHTISFIIAYQPAFSASFTSQQAAQAAYNNVLQAIAPTPPTIALY